MISPIRPRLAAATASLFALPLVIANMIVVSRAEPFFSLIRPGMHTSPQEYGLLVLVLLLLPIGALVAARPVLQGYQGSRWVLYLPNVLVAAILLSCFVAISFGLGSDFYRCEILQIPNCD